MKYWINRSIYIYVRAKKSGRNIEGFNTLKYLNKGGKYGEYL